MNHLIYAVPSAPPDNVQTGMLNLTAGWVCISAIYAKHIKTTLVS